MAGLTEGSTSVSCSLSPFRSEVQRISASTQGLKQDLPLLTACVRYCNLPAPGRPDKELVGGERQVQTAKEAFAEFKSWKELPGLQECEAVCIDVEPEDQAAQGEEVGMKFTHDLKFNRVPDWNDQYIDYWKLKKLIYKNEKSVTQRRLSIEPERQRLLGGQSFKYNSITQSSVLAVHKEAESPWSISEQQGHSCLAPLERSKSSCGVVAQLNLTDLVEATSGRLGRDRLIIFSQRESAVPEPELSCSCTSRNSSLDLLG